jgi:uncharacterized protein YndB with AHSA1/START domain
MAHLPMTRFGCMKHLQVLEEAGLVVTRKVGREKYHYLNPVPIQQVYDRWVSKYAKPFTMVLSGLKSVLEDKDMGNNYTHVYEILIKTTPEKVWQALTDGALTPLYYFGTKVESDWKVGSAYRYIGPDGHDQIVGKVLEAEPYRRLVTTFTPMWLPETERANPTTVTFEIEPKGLACRLKLIHENLVEGAAITLSFQEGWAQIFSGLKTLLETGEPLLVEA